MRKSEVVHTVDLPAGTPGTHAIVFGIGTYPFANSGSEVELKNLTSPIHSARALADWLITKFDHPARPLASVALVVSGDQPFTYTNPTTGETFEVPQGTSDDLRDCVEAWSDRAGSNFENGSVFYFCGHGVSAGHQDYLLSRSMGEKPNRYLDAVFDRSGLVDTMRLIGPKHQLFLFDTCRNEAPGVLNGHGNHASFLSVSPGFASRGPVEQSRLMASAEGSEAFGHEDGLSLFIEEWFEATVSAALREHGIWWLNTGLVQTHMKKFIVDQTPQIEGTSTNFCRLPGPPMVPVVVGCHPDGDIHRVKMECHAAGNEPAVFDGAAVLEPRHWRLVLRSGTYSFVAQACEAGDFPSFENSGIMVFPPYADITVDIESWIFR